MKGAGDTGGCHAGTEEVNRKTVNFAMNLSGKRAVSGQISEKPAKSAPKEQYPVGAAGRPHRGIESLR